MKIKTSSYSLLTRTLIDSFSIQIMKVITDKLIPGYDLYEQTGIRKPPSAPWRL